MVHIHVYDLYPGMSDRFRDLLNQISTKGCVTNAESHDIGVLDCSPEVSLKLIHSVQIIIADIGAISAPVIIKLGLANVKQIEHCARWQRNQRSGSMKSTGTGIRSSYIFAKNLFT